MRLAAFLTAVGLLGVTPLPVWAAQPSKSPSEPGKGESEAAPGPPAQANGQIVPLDRGDRAPWTGMLIEQSDLVRWRLEIDNLRFRLDRDVLLTQEKCETKVRLHTRLLAIENERSAQKDELWKQRIEELASDNVRLQKDVHKASERSFFEEPIVWYVGGIVSAGLLFAVGTL